jgi:hypothetical protein
VEGYEGRLSTLKLPIMIVPTAARHNSFTAQDFFADTRGPVLDPGGMFRAKRRAFSSNVTRDRAPIWLTVQRNPATGVVSFRLPVRHRRQEPQATGGPAIVARHNIGRGPSLGDEHQVVGI